MSVSSFYDSIAPLYQSIYTDWPASVRAQARSIDALIRAHFAFADALVEREKITVLDAACGIGTQLLGLAELGYTMQGSDLSPGEVERCRVETKRWGVEGRIKSLEALDMRRVHNGDKVDVLVALDNAVPHLLERNDLLQAFQAFHTRLKPGGLCLVSLRDYEKEVPTEERIIGKEVGKTYGSRNLNGTRLVVFQLWEFVSNPSLTSNAVAPPKDVHHATTSDVYRVSMYFVQDPLGSPSPNSSSGDSVAEVLQTRVSRTYYRAYSIPEIEQVMREAGFEEVGVKAEGAFFQPVVAGVKRM
ncbi:hypothetical protein HDU93_001667 [Gonapodya sp. JEL0774]|nr:hypothetical protein HDU93_001667 [Gonapodya sp. JEL0774]